MTEGKRALLVGTFDVDNYGDLLFPLVAAHALRPWGIDIVPVSPTASRVPGLLDAPQPISVQQMLAGAEPACGILIGGGYIVHHHDAAVLAEYRDAGVADWAYTGLWVGATMAGALRDVPVIWNAPGAPIPFGGVWRRNLIGSVLRAASHVAVRDPGSVEFLGRHVGVDIQVVPDTVLGLAGAWPRASLADAFAAMARRKGIDPATPLLAVHPRGRSLGDMPVTTLAALLDGFARDNGLTVALVAIGRSLADGDTVRALSGAMKTAHLRLDDPGSLRETAATIAFSRAYMGSSMHGYVTACAYDVPGVVIARPAHRKFGGLVQQLGRPGDMVRDWTTAFSALARNLASPAAPVIPPRVHAALADHWTRIGTILRDGDPARGPARMRALADMVAHGTRALGPDWAMAPLAGDR